MDNNFKVSIPLVGLAKVP